MYCLKWFRQKTVKRKLVNKKIILMRNFYCKSFECHLIVCGYLRISASLRTEPIREPQASENHEPNHGYQRINPRFDSVRLEQLYYGQWNNTKFNTEYHMYFEYQKSIHLFSNFLWNKKNFLLIFIKFFVQKLIVSK